VDVDRGEVLGAGDAVDPQADASSAPKTSEMIHRTGMAEV
jgi:hypothetical protein